jgi:hypothetical protein
MKIAKKVAKIFGNFAMKKSHQLPQKAAKLAINYQIWSHCRAQQSCSEVVEINHQKGCVQLAQL